MTFIMPVYERCFNYCGAIVSLSLPLSLKIKDMVQFLQAKFLAFLYPLMTHKDYRLSFLFIDDISFSGVVKILSNIIKS